MVTIKKKDILTHNHKHAKFAYNSLKLSNRYHLVRDNDASPDKVDNKV